MCWPMGRPRRWRGDCSAKRNSRVLWLSSIFSVRAKGIFFLGFSANRSVSFAVPAFSSCVSGWGTSGADNPEKVQDLQGCLPVADLGAYRLRCLIKAIILARTVAAVACAVRYAATSKRHCSIVASTTSSILCFSSGTDGRPEAPQQTLSQTPKQKAKQAQARHQPHPP